MQFCHKAADARASPFHSHSLIPPLSRIAAAKSVGSAFNNSNTSIKFDLPDPLGPISTFSGVSSNGSLSGAKESTPRAWRV